MSIEPDGQLLPMISVIIPTLGRDACLVDTIRCLTEQEYPNWECLVISQDQVLQASASLLSSLMPDRLRLFWVGEANASLARNIGLLEGRGDVALFLDDDVIIESPDLLAKHGRHYLNAKCSGVVGQVLPPDRTKRSTRHWLSRSQRNGWLYFPQNFTEYAMVRNGASNHLSVRRREALAIGGMDAQFEKGAHREESDFCLRYTDRYGPLLFDPEATLVHLGDQSGGCRTWGINEGVHPRHHVAGEWYFILRGMRNRTISVFDLPHHLLALCRRQLLNSSNLRSLCHLYLAARRSFEGFCDGRSKLRTGPRYSSTIRGNDYRTL